MIPGTVVLATSKVTYIRTNNGRLVAVHGPDTPRFPFSRVSPSWSGIEARVGDRAFLGSRSLRHRGVTVPLWNKSPQVRPPNSVDRVRRADLIATCRSLSSRHPSAHLARRIVLECRAATRPDSVLGLRRLIGMGPGLTPSGDDVLLGLSAGSALLQGWPESSVLCAVLDPSSFSLADRTTSVSAALLQSALRCEFPDVLATACLSVDPDAPVEPSLAAERLAEVGATSGGDMALGLWLSLTSTHRYQVGGNHD
jgi:hypothetical protein